jgi:NADPH:quinone reductase-like Zn-dependent oxidoreductase
MKGVGGVDAVFDPLGYESFDESYSILRKGGILVAYGMNLSGFTKTARVNRFETLPDGIY